MENTYNKNTFGIRPIHIRFISNISPDSSSILTRSMFYIPNDKKEEELSPNKKDQNGVKGKTAKTSEYPYFTDDHDLDMEKLSKLSRPKLLEVFFTNVKKFKQYLRSIKHTSEERRSKCAESNFIGMLKLLLCTSFPKKDNISDTFSNNIKQIASESHSTPTSIIDMVKGVFRNPSDKFCYFIFGGTTYTLLSSTHMNEVVNDPVFEKSFTILSEFIRWKQSKLESLGKELDIVSNKFDDLLQNKFDGIRKELSNPKYEKIIQSLNSYRANISIQKENLIPYLEALRSPNSDNKKVEYAFLNIAKNNELAKTIQYYIPYDISSIPHFMECVNAAFKKRVLQIQINYFKDRFNDLVAHMKKSKIKSDNKVIDIDEQIALDSIENSPQIKSYIDAINEISAPRRQYSNNMLTDAFSKTALNNIENISNLVIKLKSEDAPDAKYFNSPLIDFLKTGVMRVTEKKKTSEKGESDIFGIDANKYYDACISIELMKGELNKDNIEDIRCSYKNSALSNEYIKLQNTAQENNPALIYIPTVVADIDMLKQTNRKSKAKANNTRKNLRGGRTTQKGGYQPPKTRRKRPKRGYKIASTPNEISSPNSTPVSPQ